MTHPSEPKATMTNNDNPHPSLGQLPHDIELEALIAGLDRLTGPIDPLDVPTSCRLAVLNNAPTWETLRRSTINQMKLWPMVGPGRIAKVVEYCFSKVAAHGAHHPASAPAPGIERITRALGTLGAWATANGIDDDLQTCLEMAGEMAVPPSVTDAAAIIESTPLGQFASESQRDHFDPAVQAQRLLDQFDERQLAIIERILTTGVRPTQTLEELGEQFGVTREAIRLQQKRLQGELEKRLNSTEFEIVQFHAAQLRRRCGTASPISIAPDEVVPRDDNSLTDELFAWLAGPYRVSDNWIYLQDFGLSPFDVVNQAFDNSVNGFVAPLDGMLDDLEGRGIHPVTAMMLIQECPDIRVLDDDVIGWTQYRDKAGGVLQHAGHPLTITEIAERIEMPDKERSIANHLASSEHAHRVGVRRWGLKSWGYEDYSSIVTKMRSALSSGPVDVNELADHLAEQFGVSPNSIRMYASMHPVFIPEAGMVRLRQAHEPYLPETNLDETDGCVVVDGVWSYRLRVDRDVLRGSGKPLPEAFAMHIGVRPGDKVFLRCHGRSIQAAWTNMKPAIGSLRWFANERRLVDGDYILIRSIGRSDLDLRVVRASELTGTPEEDQMMRLLGITSYDSDASRESLRRLLRDERDASASLNDFESQVSESLGFSRDETPSADDIRQAIRRHTDLGHLSSRSEVTEQTISQRGVEIIAQLPELAALHPDLPSHVATACARLIGEQFDPDGDEPARWMILTCINAKLTSLNMTPLEEESPEYRLIHSRMMRALL